MSENQNPITPPTILEADPGAAGQGNSYLRVMTQTQAFLRSVGKRFLRLLQYGGVLALIFATTQACFLLFKLLRTDSGAERSDLDVIASIERSQGESNTLAIVARVLYREESVTNGRVWCIVRDGSGSRFSAGSSSVDDHGQFRIEGIPATLGTTREIRVFARAALGKSSLRGESVLTTQRSARLVNIMDPKLWIYTLAFFCTSIFFGLNIHVVGPAWRHQLYFSSIITALLLTATMLFAIADAYMKVKTSVASDQSWSVGFISIFRGTYVRDLPDQWLISLTGPPEPGNTPKRLSDTPADSGAAAPPVDVSHPVAVNTPTFVQGMGAPMWVVFLSVIGAALSTVALIVNEIKAPCPLDDAEEVRARLLGLVQNQFFTLFSPLGGIFVYQALVLAGAAVQPFAIAIAALGAGATLNVLLSLALSKARDLLMPDSTKAKPAAVVTTQADPDQNGHTARPQTEVTPSSLSTRQAGDAELLQNGRLANVARQ
jgi:hypothetical protein